MQILINIEKTTLVTFPLCPTKLAVIHCLEAEDLVLKLANGPGLVVSQTLGSLLHSSNHGWWSTDENLDVLGGRGKLLLDHIGSNEANTTGPVLRGVVEDVVHPELGVLGGERVEFVLEQNILGVHVGKDEINLGLVTSRTSTHNGLGNLQHGSDTSTAGNHTKVSNHVGSVYHGALGPSDLHLVANLEVRNVLGNVARGVRLDEEINMALVFVRGDGSVGADDFLGLAGDSSSERNVLANGEAEDVGGAGQFEAVDGSVVRENLFVLEFKLLELGGLKHLAGCWVGRLAGRVPFGCTPTEMLLPLLELAYTR